jgi:tetratricopeptide (TPR) repeat protein
MIEITANSTRDVLQRCIETGNYEAPLNDVLELLRSKTFKRTEEIVRLRAQGLALEILDHMGNYKDARQILELDGYRCRKLLDQLFFDQKVLLDPAEAELLKQRIWIVSHVGLSNYRHAAYKDALEVFQLCLRACQVFGNLDARDLFVGTISRIEYCIGLVHRELYQYSQAKHHFTSSMRYAWRASLGPGKVLATFSHAKTLALGLAWVHYIQGDLGQAIPLLIAAKDILSGFKEPLISAYVDVIFASVERSANGDRLVNLDYAIEILKRSHHIFEERHHSYYQVRATHQLALAYVQRARKHDNLEARDKDIAKAAGYVDEMKLLSQGSSRFLCLAWIVESRMRRIQRNLHEAEKLAASAVAHSDLTFTRVEALVAHGEALLELARIDESIHDFESALRDGADNPKVRGVCHLQLANIFINNKDSRRALKHVEQWRSLKSRIGTSYLSELESIVTRALKHATGDFVVHWESSTQNPEELEKGLHTFLVEWAQAKSSNDEEAAALLNISKQTLYNWKYLPKKRGSLK